jgi:hypothetical protein
MRPDLLPPSVTWSADEYRDGDLLIEHGQRHALFCSRDMGAPDGLAVGYFVSRLAASADRKSGSHNPTRHQIVTELVEMGVGKDSLTEALLDAVAAKAGVGLYDPILMPPDLWGGATVTLREVRGVYKDLVSRFERARGVLATACAIPAECGHLEPAADELFLKGATNIVMGHTHNVCLQTHLGRTYANSGAWSCHCLPTYVEFDGTKIVTRGYDQ